MGVGEIVRAKLATYGIFWLIPEKIILIHIRFVAKYLRSDPFRFLLVRPLLIGELAALCLEIYAVKHLLNMGELFDQSMCQNLRVYFEACIDSYILKAILQMQADSQHAIAQSFSKEYWC